LATSSVPDSPELDALRRQEPLLWINPALKPVEEALPELPLGMDDIKDAELRLERFAPLLAQLFRATERTFGIIESELMPAPKLKDALCEQFHADVPGRLWIKADHALPIAGSVKARGGIYEVLHFAEQLAQRYALANHTLSVASTGNLGLSVGIMGRALGFQVCVHMSAVAKQWKKERLRQKDVMVVEHGSDVTAAARAAREMAEHEPNTYFVDDENSPLLFLGYSVAALRLKRQLEGAGIRVDEEHPLFVYLPCGLGGAPCGITFGLKLLTGIEGDVSAYDIGLENATEADGLAVAVASRFVRPFARALVSGCLTLQDDDLFRFIYQLDKAQGLRMEPSAAAGFAGPIRLLSEQAGRAYLDKWELTSHMKNANHILWTTGGLLMPDDEYEGFKARGAALCGA
jgi:D-serine dehydratase